MAGGGCQAPACHNHFGTTSSPQPGFAAARAGWQLVLGPVLATVALGGRGVPRKHWWQRVVQGEAGAALPEGCRPGMATSAHPRKTWQIYLLLHATAVPEWGSDGEGRWCWCRTSRDQYQQLSRTSREPGFAPGLLFLFLPDAQCMSVKHLNHL